MWAQKNQNGHSQSSKTHITAEARLEELKV